MDPKNVHIIVDKSLEKCQFLFQNADNHYQYFSQNSNGVKTVISHNPTIKKNVMTESIIKDIIKQILNGSTNFLFHTSITWKENMCLLKVLLSILNYLENNYNCKCSKIGTNMQNSTSINELDDNTMYLQAVFIDKNKYIDVFTDTQHNFYQYEDFIIVEATKTGITDYWKTISTKITKYQPHTIIIIIFYKYRCEDGNSKIFRFNMLEILDLDKDKCNLTAAVQKMKKTLFEFHTDMSKLSAYLYIPEKNPNQCEHVVKLISDLCNIDYQLSFEKFCAELEELKKQNRCISLKYMNLKASYKKNVEECVKTSTRDCVNKLSDSHIVALRNQRIKYDELIKEMHNDHQNKIERLTEYYEAMLAAQKVKIEPSITEFTNVLKKCDTLEIRNKKLEDEKSEIQEKFRNLENKFFAIKEIVSDNLNSSNRMKMINQIEDSNEMAIKMELEGKLEELNKQVEEFTKKIENDKNNMDILKLKLEMMNDIKQQDAIKMQELMETNIKLQNDLEAMKNRHHEQFGKYEKMLKKNLHDINLHKREVYVLRQQFIQNNIYATNSPIMKKRKEIEEVPSKETSNTFNRICDQINENAQCSTPILTPDINLTAKENLIPTPKKRRGRPPRRK